MGELELWLLSASTSDLLAKKVCNGHQLLCCVACILAQRTLRLALRDY